MERLQNLCYLSFILYYKTFYIKSRKLTSFMIGCATEKGKFFVESLLSLILKHKRRNKLISRRDCSLFNHSYQFSCSSSPHSQPFRSRIKNSYKLLPCLSANALNVESESFVILPRGMMQHSTTHYNNNPGVILAIEGPPRCNISREQESSSPSSHNMSGTLVPIDCLYSPAGSTEDTFNDMICNSTEFSSNGSAAILATGSLWNPIGSKNEKFEPDIDWLAEEFIQGFYQKLREQMLD